MANTDKKEVYDPTAMHLKELEYYDRLIKAHVADVLNNNTETSLLTFNTTRTGTTDYDGDKANMIMGASIIAALAARIDAQDTLIGTLTSRIVALENA